MDDLQVDQYVCDESGFKGIVRYIGPVCISKDPNSVWVGVEWLESGRGKYDGSVITSDTAKRVRYFECSEGMGSFINPGKLSKGCSLEEALRKRYGDDGSSGGDMSLPTALGHSKVVEVFVKDTDVELNRNVTSLKRPLIVCPNDCISRIDNINKLVQLIVECEQLDLHDNIITDWGEIEKLSLLPRLSHLNISNNKLRSSIQEFTHTFNLLTELILTSTNITWENMMVLLPHMPQLKSLFLPKNKITHLSPIPDSVTASLTLIDLSENQLSSWTDICYLMKFTGLNTMLLLGNQLPDLTEQIPLFPQLTTLSLDGNNITRHTSIDNINIMTNKLSNLRILKTPYTHTLGPIMSRFEIIARIKSLMRLNGSDIRTKLRNDSERSYLKIRLEEVIKDNNISSFREYLDLSDSQREALTRNIPRYLELVKIHEEQVPRLDNTNSHQFIVRIELESHLPSSCELPRQECKIPLSMTVAKLKQFCSHKFKVSVPSIRLYIKNDTEITPTLLDSDLLELRAYNIQDDDVVIVEQFDEEIEKKIQLKKKKDMDNQLDKWIEEEKQFNDIN